MIANEKNKKPKISFGLGKVNASIKLGESITIYQNEIFNSAYHQQLYDGMFKDLYAFTITPSSAGDYELQTIVKNKYLDTERKSNKIKLTVLP